jgi:arylsulfatase A-like enzyme
LVEFIDIYPSVAEYCGLTVSEELTGTSLLPMLRDPSAPGKDAAYTIVVRGPKERGESVRTDRWRYTEWSDGSRELYDHQQDEQETHNVVDQQPDIARLLSEQLREMGDRVSSN